MTRYGYCKPGLEATCSPTAQDLAWAAGTFEGEGTCAVTRTRTGQTEYARVYQKDRWLLERFKAFFGGRVNRHTGRIRVLPTTDSPREFYEDVYAWNVTGARARGFLMTIYKFMSPRRKLQIRAALGK